MRKFLLNNTPLCKAPFVNIFISANGDVTFCCFNRKDILGNIFSQNIEKIWNSEKAEDIRKTFLNKKFPAGCHICQTALKYGNYYNSGISTYSKFDSSKNIIQTIDFELSYKCNLKCQMCYLHSQSYNLNIERENLIMKQLEPYLTKLKRAQFYGGEPFVIPVYYKIWDFIVKNNSKCIILVQTNGTIFNKEIEELSTKGNFMFNVSIDALNKELAENIRKGSKFDAIINNLNKFKKHSKYSITLAVTPMQINWQEIPNIVKFANNNGYKVFFNNLIQPIEYALFALNAQQLSQIIRYYKQFLFIPFNYNSFVNYFRYRHFINTLKGLYIEALKRPNYTANEIEYYSNIIYLKVQNKFPEIVQYNEKAILAKIKEYLQFNHYETAIDYINKASKEEIKNLVEERVNI
jgi:radical SAM protein with 4Fe4S-binding SPASM domain